MDLPYLNLSPSKLNKIRAHEAKLARYRAFETKVTDMIIEFLTAALTMICRDKNLVPNLDDVFRYDFKFGIHIPTFLNPQAKLYIEGIVKKTVALIRQNALHACIFHVKEARLYCHQRFVFKVEGDWSILECKTRDPSIIMERLENHCHNCLLKLMAIQHDLKDLQFPQFSRWSISLGIREEFMSILKENNIQNPFQTDPDHHFPWKRTVRPSKSDLAQQLDNSVNYDSESHHPPPSSSNSSDSSNSATSVKLSDHLVPKEDPPQMSLGSVDPVEKSRVNNENDSTVLTDHVKCKDDEVMMDLDEILNSDTDKDNFSSESSSWGDEDDGEEDEDEESVFLVPIYSFKVLEGLVFNIFALDYSEIVEKQMKVLGADQFLASTKAYRSKRNDQEDATEEAEET